MIQMSLVDPLASIVNLQNAEALSRGECILRPSSKLLRNVLRVMQEQGYIGEFEHIEDGKAGLIRVKLLGRINKCGVIRPRFPAKLKDMEKWEQRFLPAQNFGVLIISTPKGVMSHYEAKEKGLGGRLLAFVY